MGPREYTNRMLNLLDEGVIDGATLAEELMSWMSDDDVKQFAEDNDYSDYLNSYGDDEELEDLE